MGLNVSAAGAAAQVFNTQTATLKNGMQVAFIANHRAPVVAHMVWYKVGAIDEPKGKSGIAHFLEHLMFKGTKSIPEGEFSRRIARMGGEDNAFTSWDYTAYFQKVAVQHLPTVMEMEADRMRHLVLSEKAVTTERDVILEERRQRVDSNPVARVSEQMNAALFMNQNYRIPIIGWFHEMETLNKQDAFDFYNRFYAPDNAVLVVSGDIEFKDLLALAEKTYGQIPKVQTTVPPLPVEPLHHAARDIFYSGEDVQMPLWRRQYLAPSYHTAAEEWQPYALQVASYILGGSDTGILHEKLVMQEELASEVSTYYEPMRRGESIFYVSVVPLEGDRAALQNVASAVEASIASLAETGVSQQRLQQVIRAMQADAIYARDSLMGPAMHVGEVLALGLPLEKVEYWPEKIGAVTVEQVQQVARLLQNHASVTGSLLPVMHDAVPQAAE